GRLRALHRAGRGGAPLLPLVRRAAAPQAGRVLPPAPARPRQGASRLALPRRLAARPLQRLGRAGRRRGRRLDRRGRGGAARVVPPRRDAWPRADDVRPAAERSPRPLTAAAAHLTTEPGVPAFPTED